MTFIYSAARMRRLLPPCRRTVCICDARPLTGSRLCPGPFGWANAATGSVSGRVWAETTSCPARRALLHACPLCKCVVMRRRKPRYSAYDRMSCPQIFRVFPTYTTHKHYEEKQHMLMHIIYSYSFLALTTKVTGSILPFFAKSLLLFFIISSSDSSIICSITKPAFAKAFT